MELGSYFFIFHVFSELFLGGKVASRKVYPRFWHLVGIVILFTLEIPLREYQEVWRHTIERKHGERRAFFIFPLLNGGEEK